MAHEIETYDKQQGIEQAWHGKTEVMSEITLENNWLTNWDLVPVQLEKRGQPSKYSVLECSDNQLEIGVPYNPLTFRPITNAEFIELVRQSIAGTSHTIASVGSLRNRGRVFLSIKLQGMEKFKAAGREFSAYLNYGNGHDKSSVLWVNTSSVCTVCCNTFTSNLLQVENKIKALNDDSDDLNIRQRHTKNANLKLPEIAKLIDKAIGVQAEFALEFEKLSTISIDKLDSRALFAGFVSRNSVADTDKGMSTRAKNTVDKMVELFANGNGNDGNDLSDSFSAITDYYTHFSSGGKNVNRQIVSSDYGAGQVAKSDFWNVVRDNNSRTNAIIRGNELLVNTK